jgi:cytochrome c oxidase cbb3-type subunit 3
MSTREIDELSGVETTGHEWDGIRELDNPLPRWWLWTFYATIVFAIGYVIYYPAIPLINSSTMGISGVTNRGIVEQELKDEAAARAGIEQQIKSTSLEDIQSNEDLFRFAVAAGGSMFKVYCSQCHGSGAQGGPGYPNLNDDDWLWGGDLESIYTTISYGIRNDQNDEARVSQMPAFGADGILEHAQIVDVANYVLSLSGKEHDEKAAEAGKAVFADNCAACHGEDGKGDREFGAPNLTDPIWLYGGTEKDIVAQITHPHHGVMPAWIGRLGEVRVKELAVYVHSLGGGEKAKTQ